MREIIEDIMDFLGCVLVSGFLLYTVLQALLGNLVTTLIWIVVSGLTASILIIARREKHKESELEDEQ